MPFTPAHPALVFPLFRTPLPASALVIGSMAPDFSRYLPFRVDDTHSMSGILTVDLAVAIGVWLAWHVVLGPAALAAAPRGLQARCAGVPLGLRARLTGVRAGLAALTGLLVGALTHVSWDSFTHVGRRGARLVPQVEQYGVAGQGGFWCVQVLCSALGLAVVGAMLVRWWRAAPVADLPPRRSVSFASAAWAVVAGAACWGALQGGEANRSAGGSLVGLPDYVLPRAVALAVVTGSALATVWYLGRIGRNVR